MLPKLGDDGSVKFTLLVCLCALDFTHLRSLPHGIRRLCILLDDWENAGSHNAMGFAEVGVNFLESESDGLFESLELFGER